MKTEPEKLKEKLKEEFTVMKTDQATTSGWFKQVLIVKLNSLVRDVSVMVL